jgi:lysozyme family protein
MKIPINKLRTKTKQGVQRLQQALNTIVQPQPSLILDGIVGPYTKAAINNSCGAENL